MDDSILPAGAEVFALCALLLGIWLGNRYLLNKQQWEQVRNLKASLAKAEKDKWVTFRALSIPVVVLVICLAGVLGVSPRDVKDTWTSNVPAANLTEGPIYSPARRPTWSPRFPEGKNQLQRLIEDGERNLSGKP